ncbi:DUF924 family protein [uncultured Paenalcaligenes sp.]|uniref:DUF924 family protein n=1 Tax=uncultured Paenalcaligenes sp. TaxID=1588925 RepID=UPI00262F1D99|nr:DUF924 family protein [uncultured Paenalcaligenes sp.]
MSTSPQAVLHFWFHASTPEQWFTKDPHYDHRIRDQFSRNIWRDTPQALSPVQKQFMLMPFMPSESKAIHAEAIQLFKKYTHENSYHYEQLHKNIIDRFGRYPHRNGILNRPSTPEEILFLKEPNSSF